jgi:PKD repeat protein
VNPLERHVFPSPCKGEDEGEGLCSARFSARDSRFCLTRRAIAAFAASLPLVFSLTTSTFAQNAMPTPTPMMMPNIPQIQLQPVPAYGPAPLTVGFFVTSINPESAPIASYLWNFGDGQVSMLPPTALFHTYTTPGSYLVNVTTTDTDGHRASSFAGIVVTQPAVQQPAAP